MKKNIFVKGVLKDFEDIEKLEKNSDEYKRLQHRIINVDEFNNTNLKNKN